MSAQRELPYKTSPQTLRQSLDMLHVEFGGILPQPMGTGQAPVMEDMLLLF